MNLAGTMRSITKRLDRIAIKEGKGHLEHPEDLIFLEGSQGAKRALQSIQDTISNPKVVTIKWDGYPALIFGRNVDGKFSIMDKHMFNKKDLTGRQVFSPEQFRQYDLARGVDRTQLHSLIAEIWPGLEKADAAGSGYYWGDLLFSQPLKKGNDGLYHFKANPNGIAYTVDPSSAIGKLITGKDAAIAVHQFIPANASSTDEAMTLDGGIGKLQNNTNVAIVPSKMPDTPNLTLDKKLYNQAASMVSKFGPAVDKMISTAPIAANSFSVLFTTFINKKIVAGDLQNLMTDFIEYYQSRPMTESALEKLNAHFEQNQVGLQGAFQIWIAIYNLKMNIVQALNKAAESSPVQGYLQDGTPTQEGFVSHGLKFVDRMGFSRQNLAGR